MERSSARRSVSMSDRTARIRWRVAHLWYPILLGLHLRGQEHFPAAGLEWRAGGGEEPGQEGPGASDERAHRGRSAVSRHLSKGALISWRTYPEATCLNFCRDGRVA